MGSLIHSSRSALPGQFFATLLPNYSMAAVANTNLPAWIIVLCCHFSNSCFGIYTFSTQKALHLYCYCYNFNTFYQGSRQNFWQNGKPGNMVYATYMRGNRIHSVRQSKHGSMQQKQTTIYIDSQWMNIFKLKRMIIIFSSFYFYLFTFLITTINLIVFPINQKVRALCRKVLNNVCFLKERVSY